MAEPAVRRGPPRPAVYPIPAHRSFADALAAGLISAVGRDPLALARGRILLPNNRAVRTVTEAFVRASDGGLVLPRLIADRRPRLGERIGGALDPLDLADESRRRSIRWSGKLRSPVDPRDRRRAGRPKRCASPPTWRGRWTRC